MDAATETGSETEATPREEPPAVVVAAAFAVLDAVTDETSAAAAGGGSDGGGGADSGPATPEASTQTLRERVLSALGDATRACRDAQRAASAGVRLSDGSTVLGTVAAPVIGKLRPFLTDRRDSAVRAAALRTLRYAIDGDATVRAVVRERLHLCAVRSLEREPAYLWERMQALKFARRVTEVAPQLLPRPLARSLVVVAGESGDNFRRVALEAVRAAAVTPGCIRVIAQSGGVSVLLEAAMEPSLADLSASLLLSILLVLNNPASRQFVRPTALHEILGAFSEGIGERDPGSELVERWCMARNAVLAVLKSWTGMLLLGGDNHGLASLVVMLHQPLHFKLLLVILDTLAQALHPPTHGIEFLIPPSRAQRALQDLGLGEDDSVNVLATPSGAEATVRGLGSNRARDVYTYGYADCYPEYTSATLVNRGWTSLLRATATAGLTAASSLAAHYERGGTRGRGHTFAQRGSMPNLGYTRRSSSSVAAEDLGVRRRSSVTLLGGHEEAELSGVAAARALRPSARRVRREPLTPFHLLDGYLAVLLGLLLEHGLVRALTVLSTHTNAGVAAMSTALLRDIIELSARVLPPEQAAYSLSMPVLVQLAAHSTARTALSVPPQQVAGALPPHLRRLASVDDDDDRALARRPSSEHSALLGGGVTTTGASYFWARGRDGAAASGGVMYPTVPEDAADEAQRGTAAPAAAMPLHASSATTAAWVVKSGGKRGWAGGRPVHVPTWKEETENYSSGGIPAGQKLLVGDGAPPGFDLAVLHDVKTNAVRASAVLNSLAHSTIGGTALFPAPPARMTGMEATARLLVGTSRIARGSNSRGIEVDSSNSEASSDESGDEFLPDDDGDEDEEYRDRGMSTGSAGRTRNSRSESAASFAAPDSPAPGAGGSFVANSVVSSLAPLKLAEEDYEGDDEPDDGSGRLGASAEQGSVLYGVDEAKGDDGAAAPSGSDVDASERSRTGASSRSFSAADAGADAPALGKSESQTRAGRSQSSVPTSSKQRSSSLGTSGMLRRMASERMSARRAGGGASGSGRSLDSPSSPGRTERWRDRLGLNRSPEEDSPRRSGLRKRLGLGNTRDLARSGSVSLVSPSEAPSGAQEAAIDVGVPRGVPPKAPDVFWPGISVPGLEYAEGMGDDDPLEEEDTRRVSGAMLGSSVAHRALGNALRESLSFENDMRVLNSVLDASHVLINKAWQTWNFETVADVLDGPLLFQQVMVEVLKTKFMRRLGGFLRVETGEKAGFTHLPWMPASLRFLRLLRQWVLVLLHHREGQAFMLSDRRGSIIADVHANLMSMVERGPAAAADGGVFSRDLFSHCMAREFLSVLGLAQSCAAGRLFLSQMNGSDGSGSANRGSRSQSGGSGGSATPAEATSAAAAAAMAADASAEVPELRMRVTNPLVTASWSTESAFAAVTTSTDPLVQLHRLGFIEAFDYISRQLITVLDYVHTDAGWVILRCWTTSSKVSTSLRVYATAFTRVVLRQGGDRFGKFGVELLAELLGSACQPVAVAAASVLTEAAQHHSLAGRIVSALRSVRYKVGDEGVASPLLLSLLRTEEGFRYVAEELSIIKEMLAAWVDTEHVNYTLTVEAALVSVLSVDRPNAQPAADVAAAAAAEEDVGGGPRPRSVPRPVVTPVWVPDDDGDEATASRTYALDLVLRLPWRIAVNTPDGSSVTLDTYVDLASVRPEDPAMGDAGRYDVIVRGVMLSTSTGAPKPLPVSGDALLEAALFVGSQAVDATGNVPFGAPGASRARDGSAARESQDGDRRGAGAGAADVYSFALDGVLARAAERASRHVANNVDWALSVGAAERREPTSAADLPASAVHPAGWGASSAESSLTANYTLRDSESACASALSASARDADWQELRMADLKRKRTRGGSVRRDSAAGTAHRRRYECPRGSRARWVFVEGDDASLALECVEFCISLYPRRPGAAPLAQHLYASLGSTDGGMNSLRETDHIKRHVGVAFDEGASQLLRRASLWALGNLGSHSRGYGALLDCAPDIVSRIEALARTSPALSLRGTAVYVLGLLSMTSGGSADVKALGWMKRDGSGAPVVVPRKPSALFEVPVMSFAGAMAARAMAEGDGGSGDGPPGPSSDELPLELGAASDGEVDDVDVFGAQLPPLDPEWRSVLETMGKLCNRISFRDAKTELQKLKQTQPEMFESHALYLHVHSMLSYLRFPLPVRRYVHALFERVPADEASWKPYVARGDG